MPHGAPDDSNIVKTKAVYVLDDMAELAVRLGSPDLSDRRGDVLFATDFRDGLSGLEYNLEGEGASLALETGHQRSGAYCLKLTAGSDGLRRIEVWANAPATALSSRGIEFAFSVGADLERWEWWIAMSLGGLERTAAIRYDHVNSLVEYADVAGTWVTLAAPVSLWATDWCEHTAKMVADFSTLTYVRFILDREVYSLVDIPIYHGGALAARSDFYQVRMVSTIGNNAVGRLDSFIGTQNEP